MKFQKIGNSNIKASKVSLGLMRIAEKTHKEAVNIIKTALDSGINFLIMLIFMVGASQKLFLPRL